ncbi:MAG: hypothetical protein WBB42_08515 [Polyangiales bacterium]
MGFLRKQRGISFVRRAPTKSGEDIRIHVAKMTAPHVLWWHSHVQPIIDHDPTRADNGWNWLLYVPFAEVAGLVLTRKPAGYTIGITDPERDRFIPCALVQLLGRVPALDDHDRESVFVWFLSTAPDEALTSIEDHPIPEDRIPRRLGSIALDVAVTHSLNHRRFGRTALYADERGGDPLLQWYRRRGTTVLPDEEKLPPGPRRLLKPSDGRYCYYTVPAAIEVSKELPKLPVHTIEQVLRDLLVQDGAAAGREINSVYPDRAPLPSLRSSPAAPTPLLAEEWRQLLRRLAARLKKRG